MGLLETMVLLELDGAPGQEPMGPLEQVGALDQEPMGLLWRPWDSLRLDVAPDQEPMGRLWRSWCLSGDHGILLETTGPPGASWGPRLKTNGPLERPEAQLKSLP